MNGMGRDGRDGFWGGEVKGEVWMTGEGDVRGFNTWTWRAVV